MQVRVLFANAILAVSVLDDFAAICMAEIIRKRKDRSITHLVLNEWKMMMMIENRKEQDNSLLKIAIQILEEEMLEK